MTNEMVDVNSGNGTGTSTPSPPPAKGESILDVDLSVDQLPPLPDIHDPSLLRRIFTHRSYFARPTHMFEDQPEDPSPDNEMLEHLGDAVLSLVVTGLLREVHPYLRVGASTKIRALLVGNTTLAKLSKKYRLHDHLITHPAQAITLRASTNIQADLFESYVGGVYQESGLEVVKSWLHPLFRPYVTAAYRIVRIQHGLDPDPPVRPPPSSSSPSTPAFLPTPPEAGPYPNIWSSPPPPRSSASIGHLSLFNQLLQQQCKNIEWVYADSLTSGSRTTPIWVVRAIVEGQCVGKGRGSTKKAAKNEAAKEGLKILGVDVP
ncbi:ribonuclease III [Panus rudis PR-1116 ss-1]|nr:ribonuclease III [Panus rudis PR-1116 ss-1]